MPPPRRPVPEPLEVNDVAVITVGTALWFVALVLGLIFHDQLVDEGNEDWIWVMVAGTGLGLMGIVYLRRRRDALRSRLDKRVDPPFPGAGQPSG
jgi:hypothetical protein